MAKRISKHISYAEGVRTSVDIDNTPNDNQFGNMQYLAEELFEPLRKALGDKPIKVNSFFRSIEVNRAIGGSSRSQHRHGAAIDLDGIKSTNAEIFFHIFDNLEFDQLRPKVEKPKVEKAKLKKIAKVNAPVKRGRPKKVKDDKGKKK